MRRDNCSDLRDGLSPSQSVSARYRHLLDAGADRYIPIIRFDIARAAEPDGSATSNARYAYREADLGVRVTFAKASQLYEIGGHVQGCLFPHGQRDAELAESPHS